MTNLWHFIGACFIGGIIGGAWHWDMRRRGAVYFRGGIVIERGSQPERFDAFLKMTRWIAIIGLGLGIIGLLTYGIITHLDPAK